MARFQMNGFNTDSFGASFANLSNGRLRGSKAFTQCSPVGVGGQIALTVGNNTGKLEFYSRFYIFLRTLPSSETRFFGFFGSGEGIDQAAYLTLKSDGLIYGYNRGNGTKTSLGNGATALTTNTWYRINIYVKMRGTDVSGDNELSVEVNDVAQFTGSYSTSANGLNATTNNGTATSWQVGVTTQAIGLSEDGGGWFLFSDFVLDDTTKPGNGGVTRLHITEQGTYNDWTSGNDYRAVIRHPPSKVPTTAPRMATSSFSAVNSFTIESMASLGLSDVTIKATRVLMFGTNNFGADSKYRIRKNGIDFDSAGFSGSATQFQGLGIGDFGSTDRGWGQDSSSFSIIPSDAIEIGFITASSGAGTRTMTGMYFDVDWEGDDPDLPALNTDIKTEIGSYVGNGSQQDITLQIDPTFLMIIPRTNAGKRLIWHFGMGPDGDNCNEIISNDNEGPTLCNVQNLFFSVAVNGVNSSVNATGITYDFIAIQDESQRMINCGYRTLNSASGGTDNTDVVLDNMVTGGGITPTPAISFIIDALFGEAMQWGSPATTSRCWYRDTNYTGDLSSRTDADASAAEANAIQSIGTGTFQVGLLAGANAPNDLVYAAISAQASIFTRNVMIEVGVYTGDGTGSRIIPLALANNPGFIIVFPESATSRFYRFFNDGQGTTSRKLFSGITSTTGITALDTVGQFTVDASLNTLATKYNYIVFAGTPGEVLTDAVGADVSGIYRIISGKNTDTLYNRPGTTNVKIPNPFARTAFIGG